MRRKYILAFTCALVLFVFLLFFFSRLTEPKYVSASREGNLIGEYYREVDASRTHDVIFIGDCEAYSSFIPPVIYGEYGITSFVRGSPSQTMAQSYYLLCETLKYETPRAVVFSVYAMCKSGRSKEAYNRLTLDGMRFSWDKLCALRESVNEGESVLSYYLPLLRFHSRIYELEGEDLEYLLSRPRMSHNGYFMQKGIVASNSENYDAVGEAEPLPKENFEYLDKMREECKKYGVELILVKTPTDSWRYPWYDAWDEELFEFARENGIEYYNLIDNAEEIGIDLSRDSYDGGLHLNVYGAEKVSRYFAALLSERYGIVGEKNDIWDEKIRDYYKERNDEEI